MVTELELFIEKNIVYGGNIADADDKPVAHIPKIKSYLTNEEKKLIIAFIKEQQQSGVNFDFNTNSTLDIIGIFEASKLIYDYYRQSEQVERSEIKKLKEAIKLCAKHITKFDYAYEQAFRFLLEIENKKYFTTNEIQYYRLSFNEPFIKSLKKQSTKYPILLFYETMRCLDEINSSHYKNKSSKVAKSLENLIINIFGLKTKRLRREDKKEYGADTNKYRNALNFYFETKQRYLKNNTVSLEDLKKQFHPLFFELKPPPNYERLCNAESRYLEYRSMIERLEKNRIVTLDNKKNAKQIIEEIKNKCFDIVEGQPVLHGLSIEEEELFYSVIEQLKKYKWTKCPPQNTTKKHLLFCVNLTRFNCNTQG